MATTARKNWMEAWEADLTPSPAAGRSAARTQVRMRSTRYYSREATARIPEPARENEVRRAPALPRLKVVTRRRPQWGMVLLALLCAGVLLGASIVAPVLINSAATGLESEVGQLESQQKALAADTAALSAQISALSSPGRVAEQATHLGLGPAQSVQYVDISAETAATEGDTTVAGR
jgi:cell division protein FtsL